MTARSMYRYIVPADGEPHVITLTRDSRPVAFAATGTAMGAAVEFWAEHTEDAQAGRVFQVFGTGHPLPGDARWVGTCPRTALGMVWHLYELPCPQDAP